MSNPLVSIILTSFNQPELLQRAFNSLINQTYQNIEIIIVDDCSSDEVNKRLIKQFTSAYPQKVKAYYQEKNVGIPKNKNTGFKLAKGEFITYLDGDDTYYQDKVNTEIKTFCDQPDVDVVYSNFDIKDRDGEVLSVWAGNKKPAQGYIFEDVILNKFPDCHGQRCEMFKRNVLYDLNFYDEQFSIYHDLDFMIRYSLKYKVGYNDYVASSYCNNSKSIVTNTRGLKLLEQQEEVYAKYSSEIKEYGLQKKFAKYHNDLCLNKQAFLKKINYFKMLKFFFKQPSQLLRIIKIINYVNKKKKNTIVA